MAVVRRSVIDTAAENKILTGLIVSTAFCKDIIPVLDLDYLISPISQKVAKWAIDYYKQYEEAAGDLIQEIYKDKKGFLKEGEAPLIEEFLTTLSAEFEREGHFNTGYVKDEAVDYIKKRSLEQLSSNIKALIANGNVDDAAEQVSNFKKVMKATSNWVDPLEQGFIKDVFSRIGDGELIYYGDKYLFSFPGVLGSVIGPLERGHLIGVMGPAKRGKSLALLEFAMQALLFHNKVAFITLEMSADELSERF
jgi:replicative DNA helicase